MNNQQVVAAFVTGQSVSEIANEAVVSRLTVENILRQAIKGLVKLNDDLTPKVTLQ